MLWEVTPTRFGTERGEDMIEFRRVRVVANLYYNGEVEYIEDDTLRQADALESTFSNLRLFGIATTV